MALHVRYFENPRAENSWERILLPPNDETPCPPHCELKEANTLAELDRLRDRLWEAELEKCEKELIRDEMMFLGRRKAVADRIAARIASSSTPEKEKDLLRYYVHIWRPIKMEEYRKRFLADQAYFELREFDKARNAEEVLGERIGPGDSTIVEGR